MLDPEDSALLINLMAVAEGPQPEAGVLSLMAARLQADGGQIYHGGNVWTLGAAGQASKPLPNKMTGLRLNRVYTGTEVRGPELGDLRALGLTLHYGGAVWLVLTRTRGQFRAIDTARLAAYAPHLQQALALSKRLAGIAVQKQMQDIAARRMGIGFAHFTPPACALDIDMVARDLLAAHSISSSDLIARWPRGPIADGQLVTLAQGLDMLVLPAPQKYGQIGLIRAHNMPLPSAHVIASALGVTLAEGRLAGALAQGANLNDAARALGLTQQTARFYSKQIFAKTGLSGQPALMRHIWTSALALAR